MRSALDCFQGQSLLPTCVLASAVRIHRLRRASASERDLLLAWGAPPFTLAVHGALYGKYFSLDPDSAPNLEFLFQRVREGWVVVTMMTEPQRSAHAGVLVEVRADESLELFDPAQPHTEQPVVVSQQTFLRHWTGELVFTTGGKNIEEK